ncbi:hypothetical protein GE061_010377 [Apolygus lucorum]|uniref:Uncharacterized protein n=1 Tax=Apolygus lucorum TaxID=248454 RepID=A0A8S9Y4W3_APOLU|nr:hypothetical protein GE061_010377 [Apolygus lucorum]
MKGEAKGSVSDLRGLLNKFRSRVNKMEHVPKAVGSILSKAEEIMNSSADFSFGFKCLLFLPSNYKLIRNRRSTSFKPGLAGDNKSFMVGSFPTSLRKVYHHALAITYTDEKPKLPSEPINISRVVEEKRMLRSFLGVGLYDARPTVRSLLVLAAGLGTRRLPSGRQTDSIINQPPLRAGTASSRGTAIEYNAE